MGGEWLIIQLRKIVLETFCQTYLTLSLIILGFSPCMDSNGNCSHLCVQSREQKRYKCLCPNGMVTENGTGQNCKY